MLSDEIIKQHTEHQEVLGKSSLFFFFHATVCENTNRVIHNINICGIKCSDLTTINDITTEGVYCQQCIIYHKIKTNKQVAIGLNKEGLN